MPNLIPNFPVQSGARFRGHQVARAFPLPPLSRRGPARTGVSSESTDLGGRFPRRGTQVGLPGADCLQDLLPLEDSGLTTRQSGEEGTIGDPEAHQAPLSMRFSKQEYWSGLPHPSPSFQFSLLIFIFNYLLSSFF